MAFTWRNIQDFATDLIAWLVFYSSDLWGGNIEVIFIIYEKLMQKMRKVKGQITAKNCVHISIIGKIVVFRKLTVIIKSHYSVHHHSKRQIVQSLYSRFKFVYFDFVPLEIENSFVFENHARSSLIVNFSISLLSRIF